MRHAISIQYGLMIALCFISGTIFYKAFAAESYATMILNVDRRIFLLQEPTLISSIIPVAVSALFVLLFSTHPYLFWIALIFIAVKCTFFGYSSAYLLAQEDTIRQYTYWWFPFQLIYSILLICLYGAFRIKARNKKMGRKSLSRAIVITFCVILVVIVEITMISSVLY